MKNIHKLNKSFLANDNLNAVYIDGGEPFSTKPLLYDRYERNRETGSLILIDEGTNETVGAAMII